MVNQLQSMDQIFVVIIICLEAIVFLLCIIHEVLCYLGRFVTGKFHRYFYIEDELF